MTTFKLPQVQFFGCQFSGYGDAINREMLRDKMRSYRKAGTYREIIMLRYGPGDVDQSQSNPSYGLEDDAAGSTAP